MRSKRIRLIRKMKFSSNKLQSSLFSWTWYSILFLLRGRKDEVLVSTIKQAVFSYSKFYFYNIHFSLFLFAERRTLKIIPRTKQLSLPFSVKNQSASKDQDYHHNLSIFGGGGGLVQMGKHV